MLPMDDAKESVWENAGGSAGKITDYYPEFKILLLHYSPVPRFINDGSGSEIHN